MDGKTTCRNDCEQSDYGMTMSSHGETMLCKDQEDELMKGNGGGRQRLKHVDGDVPLCVRNKDKEEKSKLIKKSEWRRPRQAKISSR